MEGRENIHLMAEKPNFVMYVWEKIRKAYDVDIGLGRCWIQSGYRAGDG